MYLISTCSDFPHLQNFKECCWTQDSLPQDPGYKFLEFCASTTQIATTEIVSAKLARATATDIQPIRNRRPSVQLHIQTAVTLIVPDHGELMTIKTCQLKSVLQVVDDVFAAEISD